MDLNIFVKSFSKEEQLELFYLLAGQLHEKWMQYKEYCRKFKHLKTGKRD